MIIYPAIDLKDGNCVRLTKGDMGSAKIYHENPLEQAREFERWGFTHLHVVDLNGAVSGSFINRNAVESIVKTAGMPVQLGGGIRTHEAVEDWLTVGVARVILGTAAVKNPALVKEVARAFPGQIAVGIDAKNGLVATEGWVKASTIHAAELARQFEDVGVAAIIYTDIARDGTLAGPNLEETVTLAQAVKIPVILSGGIGSLADLKAVKAQEKLGIAGVIIGKALYEKKVDPRAALLLMGSQ